MKKMYTYCSERFWSGKNVLRDDILDLLVTQGVRLIIERENTPLYHKLPDWVCRFQ